MRLRAGQAHGSKAYAKRQGAGGVVKKYKLKRGLKIADAGGMGPPDQAFVDAKAEMGFAPHQFSDDPMFAGALTMLLKKKKYAGAVSDDVAIGICIFDEKNLKEIKWPNVKIVVMILIVV